MEDVGGGAPRLSEDARYGSASSPMDMAWLSSWYIGRGPAPAQRVGMHQGQNGGGDGREGGGEEGGGYWKRGGGGVYWIGTEGGGYGKRGAGGVYWKRGGL